MKKHFSISIWAHFRIANALLDLNNNSRNTGFPMDVDMTAPIDEPEMATDLSNNQTFEAMYEILFLS